MIGMFCWKGREGGRSIFGVEGAGRGRAVPACRPAISLECLRFLQFALSILHFFDRRIS